MFRNKSFALAALIAASFSFTAHKALAQTYYPESSSAPSATFAGECCQPTLPTCCTPQQYAPAAAYPQQYTVPQQYAVPQAAPTVQPYGIGQSQFSYRPLLPIAPQPAAVEVGRGILGQPTVYVPGQPVRNLFRYITPF